MSESLACKYHIESMAQWRCPECRINICSPCALADNTGQPRCPECNKYVDPLEIRPDIKPFWSDMVAALRYPANRNMLMVTAALAGTSTVLALIPFFGILLQFGVVLVFLNYAFQILKRAAAGHLSPIGDTVSFKSSEMEQPIKQLLIFVLIGIVYTLLGSEWLAATALLLMLTLLPASIMVVTLENSISKGINPFHLAKITTDMGSAYYILYAYLLALWGLPTLLAVFASESAHSVLVVPVYSGIVIYTGFVLFYSIGYALYQFQNKVGTSVEIDHQSGIDMDSSSTSISSISAGQQNPRRSGSSKEEAIQAVQEKIKNNPLDTDLHDELHGLLKASKYKNAFLGHGKNFIALLVKDRKLKKALDVFFECHSADPGFRPENPDHITLLAHHAKETGRPKLAIALTNGFAKRFPGNPEIPLLYFLAAKVMYEDMERDDTAHELLTGLKNNFPQHPVITEVNQYLNMIKSSRS